MSVELQASGRFDEELRCSTHSTHHAKRTGSNGASSRRAEGQKGSSCAVHDSSSSSLLSKYLPQPGLDITYLRPMLHRILPTHRLPKRQMHHLPRADALASRGECQLPTAKSSQTAPLSQISLSKSALESPSPGSPSRPHERSSRAQQSTRRRSPHAHMHTCTSPLSNLRTFDPTHPAPHPSIHPLVLYYLPRILTPGRSGCPRIRHSGRP
ncbi:hypothetical protein C8Q80DRAFT_209743 [Daedaleopsis nitida]|nr:hypothetical protein C8Q80DRAFT_209743 [Daedaleopsis nitida]